MLPPPKEPLPLLPPNEPLLYELLPLLPLNEPLLRVLPPPKEPLLCELLPLLPPKEPLLLCELLPWSVRGVVVRLLRSR